MVFAMKALHIRHSTLTKGQLYDNIFFPVKFTSNRHMRLARSINEMIDLLMAITWLLIGENHCKDPNYPLKDYAIWKSKYNSVNKSTKYY